MTQHQCIDCQKEAVPGVYVAPSKVRKIATADGEPKRCRTHLTAFKVRQRKLKRANHVESTYEISAEDNHALYVYQGGRCWICRKATGASKSLAVEHDHADDWVRGRCCSTCNQFITRQLGEDPEAAQRLVSYFSGDTPFRRMLAERVVRQAIPGVEPHDLRLLVMGSSVLVRFYSKGTWNEFRTTLDTLNAART